MKRRLWLWMLLAAVAGVGVLGAGAGPAAAASEAHVQRVRGGFALQSLPGDGEALQGQVSAVRQREVRLQLPGYRRSCADRSGRSRRRLCGRQHQYGTQLYNDGLRHATSLLPEQALRHHARNPAHIATLGDLTKSGTLIAMGDAAVPIGTYTRTVLTNITNSGIYGPDYSDQVMANVAATVANVNMVTALVKLGEVDAGFVYKSDRRRRVPRSRGSGSPRPTSRIRCRPIRSRRSRPRLVQPMAQRFVQFVMSSAGQKVMERWGFLSKPYPVISDLAHERFCRLDRDHHRHQLPGPERSSSVASSPQRPPGARSRSRPRCPTASRPAPRRSSSGATAATRRRSPSP